MLTQKSNFVYKIISPSGKYYIGSTDNLQRRIASHFNGQGKKDNSSLYLSRAAEKYGKENMKIIILAELNNREEAYKVEQEYLNKYFEDPLCTNLKKKAKGFSSEQAKIARANVKSIFDIDAHMKSNPELRIKQTESIKQFYIDNPEAGIKSSQLQRGAKYIEVISPEGISLGKFEDVKSLKKALPQFVSGGNISSCAKGKLPHYKKHKFIYTD